MSDATTETKTIPELEREVYPPLSDLNTKPEIVEHLRDVHGINSINRVTIHGDPSKVRVTKDKMLAYHNIVHQEVDNARWDWFDRLEYDNMTGTYRGGFAPVDVHGNRLRRTIVLPHTHAALDESAEMRAAATRARTGEQISGKPLPANQLRILTEIVRQDFRVIEQELRELAAEALEARTKEIREEYKTREAAARKWANKAESTRSKLAEQLAKLRTDAEADGVILTVGVMTPAAISTSVKGLMDDLNQAASENKSSLSRGLARLEREKAVALRRVQLAGISPEAVKLLDELPDARQMMLEASANKPKEIG